MEGDLGETILARLDDARLWRGRIEGQLNTLSHQVAELATEVRVRAEHADQRHRETSARLRDAEAALRSGDSDVDVTVTNTNSASAGGISLGKAAAATGATGVGAWLVGGGFEQISNWLKGIMK